MPLYDYQCDHCGHRFEVRQGIKDDPLTECPQCGSRIRRVIHPVGIVFKGSGFYVTDSRNSSSAGAGARKDDGAGGEKPAAETSGTSGESKPAATGGGASAKDSKSAATETKSAATETKSASPSRT